MHAPSVETGNKPDSPPAQNGDNTAKTFTFRELAIATKNFRQECLLGEGGFGRVFRATLQSSGQVHYACTHINKTCISCKFS